MKAVVRLGAMTVLMFHACSGGSTVGIDAQMEVSGPLDSRTGGQDACVPQCAGLECGDDGCGGVCGTCPAAAPECNAGKCVPSCSPDCSGKECGDDGCGASCGVCDDGVTCTVDACVAGTCMQQIEPVYCVLDGACVPSGALSPLDPCKACQPAQTQSAWTSLADGTPCGGSKVCFGGGCCDPEAVCKDSECGDDGCGGSCGKCTGDDSCVDGKCTPDCLPDCDAKECGEDGCGGTCGLCKPGYACQVDDEGAKCSADCAFWCGGRECGPAGDQQQCSCGECDDGNSCTDDACSVNGLCQFTPNQAQCDDGNPCTGPDACTGGACSGPVLPADQLVQLQCLCKVDADCAPLENGNLCDGSLACVTVNGGDSGVCQVEPDSIPECVDSNPCTDDGCNPKGGCYYKADDTNSCSDGDACNGLEKCASGLCVAGKPPMCDDDNPCTDDSCDPAQGCVFVVPEQKDCSDGNACNGLEMCAFGVCQGGVAPVCDDLDKCTTDSCEPAGGCEHIASPAACNDGLPCTTDSCGKNQCTNALQPYYCLVGGLCVPAGAENPADACLKCIPNASTNSWTYIGDGAGCGIGKVCYNKVYCDHATQCAGKQCGSDGCGGTCGSCGQGYTCQLGLCQAQPCVPACTGKQCGPDGCGGVCGKCPSGHVCAADGQCFCVPDCSGKQCGDNGCGGSCGTCSEGYSCQAGICKAGPCTPSCTGKQCGDNGCGGLCGNCPAGQICSADGKCYCIPDCSGKQCGDNGCGGNCGVCSEGYSCQAGICKAGPCTPSCTGKQCGSDGCGGSCGKCPSGQICTADGLCYCIPNCSGKQCGDNGCGGDCGVCSQGYSCQAGLCKAGPCTPDCTGKACGDDGCGGSCGTCPVDKDCVAGACVVGGVSCVGHCNGSADTCDCDPACFALDSCCTDVCTACPDLAGCKCGDGACSVAFGEDCTTCPADCKCGCGETCSAGKCVSTKCDGKECGSDGCGGSCGTCSIPPGATCAANVMCLSGKCSWNIQPYFCLVGSICVPSGTINPDNPCLKCLPNKAQVGWSALDDGTDCGGGNACHAGVCCKYSCTGKECGSDGCGGTCGTCTVPGISCTADGQCKGCNDGNEIDWDGCTKGAISEFQVNGYWTGNQSAAAVAALPNGGMVVTWHFDAGGSSSYDVHVRLFDKNMKPAGIETLVPPNPLGSQINPDVVALPDNRFIVFWQALGASGTDDDVFGQRYLSTGEKDGQPFNATPDSTEKEGYAKADLLSSGDIVLVTRDTANNDSPPLWARRMTSAGTLVGFKLPITAQNSSWCYQSLFAVTSTVKDGFFAAWSRYSGNEYRVYGAAFDKDGVQIGPLSTLAQGTNLYSQTSRLASLKSGDLIAAWHGNIVQNGNYEVSLRRLTSVGTPVAPSFVANTNTNGTQSNPLLVPLPDGGYAVTWNSDGAALDASKYGVHLQRFASNDTKVGGELLVNTYTTEDQAATDVASFPDGSFVVVFNSNLEDGSNYGVFAQRFNAQCQKIPR